MQASASAQEPIPSVGGGESLLPVRLLVGLIQGLLAWLLMDLSPHPWATPYRMAYSALVLCTAFLPMIALAQIGSMRARHLLAYGLLAAAALCGLGGYDVWRGDGRPYSVPSYGVILRAAIGLFIVNQLLEHRERGYALFGDYAAYIERGWMCLVRLLFASGFAVATWCLLKLGALLFIMVGEDWISYQMNLPWFYCLQMAMAFALAVHLTDVRPAVLLGVRNLVMMLMAWLLPLAAVLGWCFLAALPFTSLHPLWATRHAATTLLWSAAVTLVLVNAAYRDGRHEQLPSLALQWAARAAAPMLLAFGMLAACGLFLRIHQYGWTPSRILGAAVDAVALLYGAGYTWAALRRGAWLRTLEPVNVMASLVMLVMLAALSSPLADPSRLAVNSQLARLREGKVPAQAFDFSFLRSGRYGRRALEELGTSADAQVASLARKAASGPSAAVARTAEARPEPKPEPALSRARVYPPGTRLPATFVAMPWRDMNSLDVRCMVDGTPCEIYTLLPKAGVPHYVVIQGSGRHGNSYGTVFGYTGDGTWYEIGKLRGLDCPGVLAALRAGRAKALRPRLDDLEVAGLRLEVTSRITVDPCSLPAP
ncbi:DUF4153 domain-containing protein [Thiomonas sp.]|uniref:DUF4153 domain-containing protein n=1 Tax=Thiomonas sp. TaxID=2047785 RepID=UPI00262B8A80|nr:DUF4153 domain-containing protein [Thiomonas sp.]